MSNCINCGGETECDWCINEFGVCLNCGDKLESGDDVFAYSAHVKL